MRARGRNRLDWDRKWQGGCEEGGSRTGVGGLQEKTRGVWGSFPCLWILTFHEHGENVPPPPPNGAGDPPTPSNTPAGRGAWRAFMSLLKLALLAGCRQQKCWHFHCHHAACRTASIAAAAVMLLVHSVTGLWGTFPLPPLSLATHT